jgi:hypothetical protein
MIFTRKGVAFMTQTLAIRSTSALSLSLACLLGLSGCGEPTPAPLSNNSAAGKNIKTGDTAKGFGSEVPKGTDLGPPLADPNPPAPVRVR